MWIIPMFEVKHTIQLSNMVISLTQSDWVNTNEYTQYLFLVGLQP